jgi:hypothetical protein
LRKKNKPILPIQSLIGLTTRRRNNTVVDFGDGLITYEGQRFRPNLSIQGGCPDPVMDHKDLWLKETIGRFEVTEKLLGTLPRNTRPKDKVSHDHDGGYRHSRKAYGGKTRFGKKPPAEPLISCAGDVRCAHDAFVKTKNWLKAYPAKPIKVDSSPLNDTGITWRGDYILVNNVACTSNIAGPQDCHQGRDSTHNDDSDGHAGFSFTKISSTGAALPASATSWYCVKDNVTGLVWEKKTDDGGIHDKDNSYRWGGKTSLGSGFGTYYDDWDGLVDGSNNENLCGFSDWRAPTIKELENLAGFGSINPAIDTGYFPNTRSSRFWLASPIAYLSLYAWGVSFSRGNLVKRVLYILDCRSCYCSFAMTNRW